MSTRLSKDLSIEELKLLGEAIDSSPSPLTLYDNDFNLIYANPTSQRLWPELHAAFSQGLGLEAAARRAAEVLFEGAPEAVIENATQYAIYTFLNDEPNEMMSAGGQWAKLTHHRIGDKAVAGMGVDITAQKKREKELERAKKAQDNLIDVLQHGLLVISEEGTVTSFNSAYTEFCKTFGIKVSRGMGIRDLVKMFVEADKLDLDGMNFDEWFDTIHMKKFSKDDRNQKSAGESTIS